MNSICFSPSLCYASIFCRTNKAMDIRSLGGYIVLSVYLQPFINRETIPSLTKRGTFRLSRKIL